MLIFKIFLYNNNIYLTKKNLTSSQMKSLSNDIRM